MNFFWITLGFICLGVQSIYCQDTELEHVIDTIYVSATKIRLPLDRIPRSVYKVQINETSSQVQGLSVNEHLQEVPGLFAQNANNFAQDLRVTIRGFGARAAFGIRGVKLIVDGIPETTPDGQGQIDNLTLDLIENIEVIRGPSSSLYGNASGGVINISSQYEFDKPYLSLSATKGSYGFDKYSLDAGFRLDNTSFNILGSTTNIDGYRDHSSMETSALNFRVNHDIDDHSELTWLFNYTDSPLAEDPGGINLESAMADRRQARDRNVSFGSGESIDHLKTSLSYRRDFHGKWNLHSYFFYSTRGFDGYLPFGFGGAIDLNRTYWGHGSSMEHKMALKQGINRFLIGYEIADQSDERMRFVNESGTRGNMTLDQTESFNALSFYVVDHLMLDRLTLSGGLRFDYNKIGLSDHFNVNATPTPDRTLSRLNPSLGLQYEIGKDLVTFINFSNSFETPTLSELSANPVGEGGFNEELDAQKATMFELGWRGRPNSKTSFELVFFHINTTDEIIPFELEQFPGRDFFRNAGSTKRYGAEASVSWMIKQGLNFNGHYSLGRFEYETFLEFDGNDIPGIPRQTASFSLSYTKNRWSAKWLSRFNGSLFANDSNQVEVESFSLSNFSLSYEIDTKSFKLKPFFGINNVFNSFYNDNVRINAFGGRYFEPAPERNVYFGLKLHFE